VEARVVPESDLTEWILGQLASERTYLVAVTPEVSA
jgi:hypothetical protein